MGTFTAAPHHDILVLLIQLAALLFTARFLGEIAQRLGQPSVVGEILSGIILGPSLLSGIFPFIEEWIVPHNEVQGYLLELVGLMGVIFLLLITGLETDLALIQRQARSAIGVAVGGLLLPLSMGFGLGLLIPDRLLADSDERFVFAMFVATAMSISAIPVVAKVLMDLNLTRRDIGQTIIASAMIDDSVGWILLSIVIGLASGAGVTLAGVAQSVGSVIGLMLFSFTIGQWIARKALAFVQNQVVSREKTLSLVMIMAFVWGAISQALNLEAMLGAFFVGIIFSRIPTLDSDVIHKIESIALGVFAPIFFAIAGLKVNIQSLFEPEILLVAVVVIAVATICKVAGVYAGARLIGKRDHWTALFFGAGLNARGSMEIIVATIGLSLGILTQDMFSIIVVMAVTTSLMAPALLRWALSHIQMDAEEQERLKREEMNRENIITSVKRVLMPVRVRETQSPTQIIEASLLSRIGNGAGAAVTMMTVSPTPNDTRAQAFLTQLSALLPGREVTRRIVASERPADAILDEARKGYDLMILGATERQNNAGTIFNPVVDTLVRLAPCPTIVVHGRAMDENWQPRKILVATTGSIAGRHAAQLAFALASGSESKVTILKVVQKTPAMYDLLSTDLVEEREIGISHQMVDELVAMGGLYQVQAEGRVEIGAEAEASILSIAKREDFDLILLGTNVRPGSDRLYLGPKVERILSNAPCPVMIINSV